MKKTTITLLLIISFNFLFAQSTDTFQAGWYIIQPKALYSTLFPGYSDVLDEKGRLRGVDQSQLLMAVGETVLAFDQKGEMTYCFDPLGRMLVFKGNLSLKKAPITAGSGVGHLLKDIEVLDGDDIKSGSAVWVIGQDISKNTIKIMVENEKTYEVPRDSIELITKTLRNIAKEDAIFKEATK